MATPGGSKFPSVDALKAIIRGKFESDVIEAAVQKAVGDLGAGIVGVVDNGKATANLTAMGTVDIGRSWVQGGSHVSFLFSALTDDNLILVLAAGLAGRPFAYPLLYIREQLQSLPRQEPGTVLTATDIVKLVTDFHAKINGIDVGATQAFLARLYQFDRPFDAADAELLEKLLPLVPAGRRATYFMGNTWKDPKSPTLPILPFDPTVIPIVVPTVDPGGGPVDPDDQGGGGGGGGEHTGGGGGGGHTGGGGGGNEYDPGERGPSHETGHTNDVSKDNSMPIIIVLILFACIILFVAVKGKR